MNIYHYFLNHQKKEEGRRKLSVKHQNSKVRRKKEVMSHKSKVRIF
ncbi:MAG: hypothetical protein SWX82_00840 [Cyanobacteriota bacterium]|nr:hypothetical protein [Cyanobacteriota bacterium]